MNGIDVRPYWLCVDPGETTGYSIWDQDGDLVWADQMAMWKFVDTVFQWVQDGLVPQELLPEGHLDHDLKAMVIEQWQLYPWKLQELAWDECRTARVIGALTFICRQFGIKVEFQGADVKEGAQAAGAEALYLEPVHENRHANDSIQHGVFYLAKNGGPPC